MNQTAQNTEIRVALVGYGQMGRQIEQCAAGEHTDVVARYTSRTGIDPAAAGEFDVAIEFTRPAAAPANIRALLGMGKPVVVGTTGWLDHLPELTRLAGECNGRLIYASNFSIGVNIFFRLVREAGRLMNDQALYDVAVHELHHIRKADAPSGTGLTIANILVDALDRKKSVLTETPRGGIPPEALHLSSQRVGETIGTHIVTFDSMADSIELTHRAKDRSGFALGALYAARWIMHQPPGVYRFEDIL